MNTNALAHIISYQDMLDIYMGVLDNTPKYKVRLSSHTLELRKEVLDFLIENKDVLQELENKTLKFAQLLILESPIVYIAKSKDVKTDIEYLTAKTRWPQVGGRTKEIKIHLGKASLYEDVNGMERAKKEAQMKMRQTIARRMREGTL